MLRFIASGLTWHGEEIDGVRHPRDIEQKWSAADLEAIGLEVFTPPAPPPPTFSALVNAERDRRIGAGFTFDFGSGAVEFDSDEQSRENIAGALGLAQLAIAGGAQPGDLRWSNPSVDFAWIAADNSQVTMDAQTCAAFCAAAMGYKGALYMAARAIKDADPAPADHTDDVLWPSRDL